MYHSFVFEHDSVQGQHHFLQGQPKKISEMKVKSFVHAEAKSNDQVLACIKRNHAEPDNPHEGTTLEQRYEFPMWSAEPERENWLREHEDSLVCILSVSLIRKRMGLTTEEMFNRKNILEEALETWKKHGWYCLVFVPHRNHKEYTECFDIENRFGDHVRLASYTVSPDTCGKSMVVGESRNAILHFVLKYKHIFRTCTIADERIAGFWYGIREVAALKDEIDDEQKELVDEFRNEFGFDVVRTLKQALYNPNIQAFKNLQRKFKRRIKQLKKKLKKKLKISEFDDYYTFDTKIYNKNNKQLSLWHAFEERKPTLIGIASARSGASYANNEEPIRETTRKSEKVAQFATFKVGGSQGWKIQSGKGWRGQCFYTKTTMMEDNVWSYNWDENEELGNVAEIYCVSAKRLRGLSLTRRKVNLSSYSECALLELVKALMSNSYEYHEDRGGRVTMRWTTFSEKIPLHLAEPEGEKKVYWHMASLIAGIADVCDQRNIDIPIKIRNICECLENKLADFLYEEEDSEEESEDELVINAFSRQKIEGSLLTSGNLVGVGRKKLQNLDVVQLRKECKLRDITISNAAHKNTCISELLKFKKQMQEESGDDFLQTEPKKKRGEHATEADNETVAKIAKEDPNSGDNIFFITHASPMKGAVSSTGAIFKSTIRFGSGETAQVILKIFRSKNVKKEFEITEKAYDGTDVKLYYTAFASKNINVFISDQLGDLCAPNMNPHEYDKLERKMKSLRLHKSQDFGIMIMTNIHSFGKLYRHSYVSGRYPRNKILKKNKYMQRWKFNGLHQMLSLHQKGIVHGDLNYGNVWILEQPASKNKPDVGKVFIIDFGESFEKKDASIIDELEQLPQSTSDEQNYLRNSLPWKLRIFMREMNKTLKKKYLKVYPKDEEQLNYELSLINDEGQKKD